ncbi:APC family permease [Gandjariella thermophila]|uniref:Amino acid transporter n=1 Tax=Gandjariella thermophila TaxID=1931992 RepID=A0A4D4J8F5_9PSEU|nr:APC family permease [Gandjariella thermophila]GDY32941.1 amino acid transporter [Gandjariella thermophila]
MSKVATAAKRLLVGRPFRSDRLGHTLLPKAIALPVFASDALSSVAYAPEEVFRTLSVAGLSAYSFSPWVGGAVALVMLVVVASYRQNVHAYPSGGGDYEVATTNLGQWFGLTVGSALMVDYVLTVAVSTSSGIANIGSAIPFIGRNELLFCLLVVGLLTVMNLRGVRESGTAFAIPTYGFMAGVFGMVAWGVVRLGAGADLHAESAAYQLRGEGSVVGLGFAFLLLRTFSSGCAALTGVEAISNGVPAFRKPKSRNAATTLLMMGLIAVSMLMGIIGLAIATDVHFADDPATQLVGAPADYQQKTILAQIAQAVFSNFPPGFYYVSFVTGIILVLAANTAFNGFPVLGSILAQNRYLPRQLYTRGDRLAYSNGILFLAVFATVLIVAFDADATKLIQLYIVGVFVSFTCSQAGMIRHWNRLLRTETDRAARRRMRRSQTINAIGLSCTGVVLVIVVVTKFAAGAWIAIAAMAAIFLLMSAIRRHYDGVALELQHGERDAVLPARNHAIVLVSQLHLPTVRALAYAKAIRPDRLEAVTVNVDDAGTRELMRRWEEENISVPLRVVESPYREITRPVLEYVRRVRTDNPRDVVTVFIPEYVVGHWWEHLLHNQSALRLKTRLLFQPGVMVTSVPWQLTSSRRAWERAKRRQLATAPGSVRRGLSEGPARTGPAAGS